MKKSHRAIGLVLGAASIAIAGTYAGYKQGVRTGIRKQAEVTEAVILQRIEAVKREAAAQARSASDRIETLQKAAAASANATDAPYISSAQELADETSRLMAEPGVILPKRFFLVEGKDQGIYWKNIVPAHDPEAFVYTVTCSCTFAENERRRIHLSPPSGSAGRYSLMVAVADNSGKEITRNQVELVVVPSNAGSGQSFQMLLIGDSLGHQSRFPNRLAGLFDQSGNPEISFKGSHHPAGSKIDHEQYGGWTFQSFLSNYNMDPKVYHTTRSPFVFEVDGQPKVDVQRYLAETLNGAKPDFVHIQLGINDAFGIDPDGSDIGARLDAIMQNAETLISAIRKALPEALITVGSVIQGNATDRAFIESYRGSPKFYSEWRWRRVQLQLAKRMVGRFESGRSDNVFLVPTHMTVDSLDGYNAHVWKPEGVEYDLSNAVHPSHVGDKQLAGAIYGVLKARLAGALSAD